MTTPIAALIVRPDGTAEVREVDLSNVNLYHDLLAARLGWVAFERRDYKAYPEGITPEGNAGAEFLRSNLGVDHPIRQVFGDVMVVGQGSTPVPTSVIEAALRARVLV